MKKINKKPEKLKQLKAGEIISPPCGAGIEVLSVSPIEGKSRSLISIRITSSVGLFGEDGRPAERVYIDFFGKNIPVLIKTLRRAYLTK